MSLRCLSCVVLLLSFSAIASAQDRYVSISGRDTNTGLSITTPWRTLTHAAATAPSNANIHVGAGTFGTKAFGEGIEIKNGKRLFWHGAGMGRTIVKANAKFSRTIRYYYAAGSTTVAYTAIFIVHGKGTKVDLWDMTLDADHLSSPTRLACAVYADGGNGLLNRVEMRNAGAIKPDGNLRHVGMIANGTNTGANSSVTLVDCHVHHWNKIGVVMGGKKLTGAIQTCLIEGSGRINNGGPAQNGIYLLDGGTQFTIRDNLIRDIWFVPSTWNAVGILNLDARAQTTISGNRIVSCKTGYYHRDGTVGQVTLKNNRMAACGWGTVVQSNRLTVTGNHMDAEVGVYVGGTASPKLQGNYFSDFRGNRGFPTKYVADGNTAVQDLAPLTKPLGFDPGFPIKLGKGSAPEDLVTGDFNADGRIDFAVANGGTNKVTIYYGSGGTDFSKIASKSVGVPNHPLLLATGEFSGARGEDLVCVARDGKAYILKNNGSGSFSLGAAFQVVSASDAPSSIASGQANGLDEDDFIVGFRGNGLSRPGGIKIQYVKGSIISAGLGLAGNLRSIEDVGLEDINGDSKPDILAVDTKNSSGTNNKLQVWIREATSSAYGALTSYAIGDSGRGLGLGDLDRDGDIDVVVSRDGNTDGWVQIFEGQGGTSPTGSFLESPQSPIRIGTAATEIEIVDLQEDGDPDTERVDVVVIHPTKGSVTLMRRWGGGGFESFRGVYTAQDPRAFAFAHLDNGLLPDLLVAGRGDDSVVLHLDDPDALLQSYGVGGAGGFGRVPQIVQNGYAALPLQSNPNFRLQVRNARAFSVGVFLFSLDAVLDSRPCALQVSFLSLFWMPAVATDRFGNASFPIPIPNNPALVGDDFYTQLAVFDPMGCLLNSFSLTQAVRIRIGH